MEFATPQERRAYLIVKLTESRRQRRVGTSPQEIEDLVDDFIAIKDALDE